MHCSEHPGVLVTNKVGNRRGGEHGLYPVHLVLVREACLGREKSKTSYEVKRANTLSILRSYSRLTVNAHGCKAAQALAYTRHLLVRARLLYHGILVTATGIVFGILR